MLVKAIPGTLRAGGAPFQPTHWTVVLLAAQSQSLEAAQAALANFCQAYWPPLYAFVRRRGYPSCEAQDCVQAFFVHLLEANTLSRACREKGHLRTFLLGSLQHFMAKDYHRANALKRGGGKQIVSLEDCLIEAEAAGSTNTEADESACYDQNWAAALTRRAWTRLHEAFAEEGKESLFEELKAVSICWTGRAARPGRSCRQARDAGCHVAHAPASLTPALPRVPTRGSRADGFRAGAD